MTVRSVIPLIETQKLWKHRHWDTELFWLYRRRQVISIAQLHNLEACLSLTIIPEILAEMTHINGRDLRYEMEIRPDTTMLSAQSEIS